MIKRFPDAQVHLETGELLDIHDGEGSLVTCLCGVVWITQSNDRHSRRSILQARQERDCAGERARRSRKCGGSTSRAPLARRGLIGDGDVLW
jgi:hypothetical protein